MTLFGMEISYLSGIYITAGAASLYLSSVFFVWTLAAAASKPCPRRK